MKLKVARDSNDKLYVDSDNNITAKGNEIITIIIPTVRGGRLATIANTIGLHLGLQGGELHTFKYLYILTIKNTTKYFGRSYIVECLTKQHGCSTRTINRYIDALINKKIFFYDVHKFTIKLNPEYVIEKANESVKAMTILFAAPDQ